MARKARILDTDAPVWGTPENLREIEIPGTGVMMQGHTTPHATTPPARPFVFPKESTRDIAVGIKLGLNIALTGPTGCGKTALPTAIAHVLGKPLIRFNMDGETRVSNLRGMQKPVAVDGVLTLQFELGDLARAMRDGYWVILDEVDAALPSVLFVLQPVLEEGNRSLRIPETGSVIDAHPDFRVFATANTIGYRAMSRASHAGTNPMNSAFVDRFGMIIAADYPDRLEEIERVRAHCPDVLPELIDGCCRVAAELRTDHTFSADMSTRRIIQWTRLLPHFDFDVLRAFELACVRKLENPTDAKVAREICKRIFAYDHNEVG